MIKIGIVDDEMLARKVLEEVQGIHLNLSILLSKIKLISSF